MEEGFCSGRAGEAEEQERTSCRGEWKKAPDTIALFQQIPDTELIFFTDGSCTHPTMPDTCYSAFSIVGDLCQNDLQRRDLADVFLTQQTSLSSLQTLLVGRTQGRQHIHRAELTAIIVLCESFQ